MALNWNFEKDRMGTAITNDGNEITLYNGNAFVIALYETDTTYQMAWFFVDEQHAKNCIGLTKGYNGSWSDFNIKKLNLNVNFKETAKLINLLCKAKAEVEILLYNPPF